MEIGYSVSFFSSGAILWSASTIVDVIYSQPSVADIISLSKVCKATYYAVKAWFPSVYNINSHLKKFFGNLGNVLAFRSLQAATGTIISGSQALQFFDRTYYPGSDLDIYVPCRDVTIVGNFFLSIGYLFEPNEKQLESEFGTDCQQYLAHISSREPRTPVPEQEDEDEDEEREYDWRFVAGVINFTKKVIPDGREKLKVQLMVIEPQSSPLACILHFHSTLVMNLITHDRAYSLFPRATFIKRTGITIESTDRLGAVSRAYGKYTMRDFKISLHSQPLNDSNQLLIFGPRWVGDSETWTIKLNTTDVVIPDWIKEVTNHLGLPLLACQGFSVRKNQPVHAMVQNPLPKLYQKGDVLLAFELICCTVLHQTLVVPVSDSPTNIGRWPTWTSYPATYKFMLAQQKLEELKLRELKVRGHISRRSLRPETVPGWKFWDTEVLQFVHREYSHIA
ncbi:hypothetical protein FRB91_008868 [Serendipita sp. 411]|nr:hypothetical protein FRB91_008868 [Serendipita sp. 411]